MKELLFSVWGWACVGFYAALTFGSLVWLWKFLNREGKWK